MWLHVTATPASSPSVDPWSFAQFGIGAIVFILMATAIVWLAKRLSASEQRERDLNKVMSEQMVPLATRMLDALKEAGDFVRDAAHHRDQS